MKLINNIYSKLSLSTNKKKVVKNIYWAVLGKVVNIVSGLLVGIFIARYLGPDQYGIMNYVVSFVTLFNVLATFGFDNIEIRELSRKEFSVEKILGTAIVLRLFFATTTFLLVVIIASIFETDSFTFWMIIIYALSLIFQTLNIIRNYFTSIVLNEYVVKSEIARTVFGGVIKVILLLLHAPLKYFILALTFDFLIICLGYIISYKKKKGNFHEWSFDKKLAFYQIKESFPLLFSGAAIIVYQKIDQVMIKNMINESSVGQYAVGAKLAEFLVFIPMVISQTISPLLVRARERNQEEYEKKRQSFLDIIFWSTFVFSLLLSLVAKPVILMLYGDAYREAIPVLQIMSWKAVFSAMFSSSGQIIIIQRIQKFAVFRNLLGCAFSVVMNLLLIPIYGILGSAAISIMTLFLTGFLSHLIIKPYREIFFVQSNSIFSGFFRIKSLMFQTLKKLK